MERAQRRVDVAVDLPDEPATIDAVRERQANELVAQGRMASRPEPEVEMLECSRRCHGDADSALLSNSRKEVGWHTCGDVELSRSKLVDRIRGRWDEPHHDAVEIRRVRPPVPGIPAQDELSTAVPAFDEEGAAPDRLSRPRVVDAGAPHFPEIRSAERMLGKNVPEQLPPAGRPRLQDDTERLGIDGMDAANDAVKRSQVWPSVRSYRVQREQEVACRYRLAVAPRRVGTDAIRQRERGASS